MSATFAAAKGTADRTAAPPFDRADPPQYLLARILAVWATAAVPMGILAWIVVPWLTDRLGP